MEVIVFLTVYERNVSLIQRNCFLGLVKIQVILSLLNLISTIFCIIFTFVLFQLLYLFQYGSFVAHAKETCRTQVFQACLDHLLTPTWFLLQIKLKAEGDLLKRQVEEIASNIYSHRVTESQNLSCTLNPKSYVYLKNKEKL